MRFRTLAFLLSLATAAFAGDRSINIHIADDGAGHASWTRDGVRYETGDRDVLDAIDAAMRRPRDLAHEQREAARKQRDLGREQARIAREHARAAREHARTGDEESLEQVQRDLESLQAKLEAQQEELERQREALDERRRLYEDEVNRELDAIFAKAVREGKARRAD